MNSRNFLTTLTLSLVAVASVSEAEDRPQRLPASAFDAVVNYDFGKSRAELAAIEESLRGAEPEELRLAEEKLLAVLSHPKATFAGKQFACRILRRIGSCATVKALAPYLREDKLSHLARWTLERLPCPDATKALLAALRETTGNLRLGMLSSLGGRGDRAAVKDVASLLTSKDSAAVLGAVRALGRLAGEEAANALRSAQFSENLERQRDRALLACADDLSEHGESSAATAIYREIASDAARPVVLRLGAYRGLLLAQGAEAVPVILALLKNNDRELRDGAARLLHRAGGSEVTRALAAALPSLDTGVQTVVIDALVERGDQAAAAALTQAASSPEAQVRIAAVRALGSVGNSGSVSLLIAKTSQPGAEADAAFESLAALRGPDIASALLRLTEDQHGSVRESAVKALEARRETQAAPALMRLTEDGEVRVRTAAYHALSVLGGPGELRSLLEGIEERSSAVTTEVKAFHEAVRAMAERSTNDPDTAKVVLAAQRGASPSAQLVLLGLLPVFSTNEALTAVRAALKSSDERVVTAATEALGNWHTADPAEDLLAIASHSTPSSLRSTAFRGYLRLVSLPANRPSVASVRLLEKVFSVAPDVDQKRAIVAKLAEFPCREGLELAEGWSADPQLAEAASAITAKIRNLLLKSGLVATASHGGSETRNAFDDDPKTRWTTGTPMRPGMWFAIDLGVEQSVTRLILDSANSPGDYPRGCEVYASFDGETWGDPVLTSPPQRPITRLVFEKPVRARFLKIVQTGSTQGLYWSIHELRVVVE